MTRLHYSVDIDAPRQRVWEVLWDDKTYPDWTSAFMEGSRAVSDWKEGSRIQFLGPGGDGKVSQKGWVCGPHKRSSPSSRDGEDWDGQGCAKWLGRWAFTIPPSTVSVSPTV